MRVGPHGGRWPDALRCACWVDPSSARASTCARGEARSCRPVPAAITGPNSMASSILDGYLTQLEKQTCCRPQRRVSTSSAVLEQALLRCWTSQGVGIGSLLDALEGRASASFTTSALSHAALTLAGLLL